MVRDLMQITGDSQQQTHFSFSSMFFLLAAAVSSVVATWLAGNTVGKCGMTRRGLLCVTMVVFGLGISSLPVTHYIQGDVLRICWFYVGSITCGWGFGFVYALFQSCMWSLLPTNTSDIANAMGFAQLCKCIGLGLGNLIAGCILDTFSMGSSHHGNYAVGGYWTIISISAFLVLSGAVLTRDVEGID